MNDIIFHRQVWCLFGLSLASIGAIIVYFIRVNIWVSKLRKGICPKCGDQVYETSQGHIMCKSYFDGRKYVLPGGKCDFVIWKFIEN